MSKQNTKRDYFESGKPVHRLSYCAFLDILGYSAQILNSYKDKNADKLLRRFHTIFKKQLAELQGAVDDSMLYFKSFSDNVLLAHPRFSHENDMESEFAFILWSIKEYQFEMALNGLFIRGGLSVGPLFMDNNNVYGKALIDAYELESKKAVNPIVVLCDRTMALVDKHVKYYSGMTAPQIKIFLLMQTVAILLTIYPKV